MTVSRPSDPRADDLPGGVRRVRAVCVVHHLVGVAGRVGVSGIDKRPVEGPVPVGPLGVRGDVQADRAHHGGEDQAVYLLSDGDVAPFDAEFGGAVALGGFGENLRLSGPPTTGLVIGTRLAVGSTLELEVTSPRIPCRTFAEWTERARWVRRFTEVGRPGAHTRVRHTGKVAAGDEVRVLEVPDHGVTVGEAFAGPEPHRAAALLDSVPDGALHRDLADRLRRWAGRSSGH